MEPTFVFGVAVVGIAVVALAFGYSVSSALRDFSARLELYDALVKFGMKVNAFKGEGPAPEWAYQGICRNVLDEVSDKNLVAAAKLLNLLFKSRLNWSGDSTYPILDPINPNAPVFAYQLASRDGELYDPKTPYGRERRRALNEITDHLDQMIHGDN